jgi:hypothetical protein
VRPRDPRRLLARGRGALARVNIIRMPPSGHEPDGSIASVQTAEVTLPRSELDRIWTPEYLERLARTYWRFLTRVSLGLLRVRYTEDSREIVFIGRPFVLLRFLPPEYEIEADRGSVTWRIQKGVLVAPSGRGKGYLRISVWRPPDREEGSDEVTVWVSAEVANFYPMLAGARPAGRVGWLRRVARIVYRITQGNIHVIVTHAFLRSLARLDLATSRVGALAPPANREAPSSAGRRSRAASRGRGER